MIMETLVYFYILSISESVLTIFKMILYVCVDVCVHKNLCFQILKVHTLECKF